MNMIQKMYTCLAPEPGNWDSPGDKEFQVSAWMAQGSNSVNIRLRDEKGWYEYTGIISEKLSDYYWAGVRTMDDLIEWLYWVKA